MNISLKGKILLGITALFAIYNVYEIAIVASSSDRNAINGFPDLLLPVLLIANLVWVIRRKDMTASVSLLLCAVSIIGMVVMLKSISITPF